MVLSINSGFWLQIPEESKKRLLRPVKLLGISDDLHTAQLEEAGVPINEDTDVFIYYEIRNTFTQQAAHVIIVDNEGPKPVIEFRITGEPVSVEGRQAYRVSAVTSNLMARLGDQNDCQLLDVSCSGFSVAASATHNIAKVLDVTLSYEGRSFSGKCSIQSIRELSPGRIRYGLHCSEDKSAHAELVKGLRLMTTGLQRDQLRRMAGSV